MRQATLIAKQRCQQAWGVFRHEGLGVLVDRIVLRIQRLMGMETLGNFDRGYDQWRRKRRRPTSVDDIPGIVDGMETKPIFSVIVPVYNVDPKWLKKMVESVQNQLYPHWQLCLVDDCSTDIALKPLLQHWADTDPKISVLFNKMNSGIAATSNQALSLAKGDYIALLDHDDALTEDALLENALAINLNPGAELLYSDEDKITLQGKHKTPFFKPDFSLDLLRSQNYIGHFVVIKKSTMDEIGGFTSGLDGAQDYDLVLRLVEHMAQQTTEGKTSIVHIPKVLYHWREIPASTAAAFSAKSYAWEAGQKALQQHFHRLGIKSQVRLGKHPGTYVARYEIDETPLVSIIIPFKDQAELLNKCLASLFEHTQWPRLEVIAIDNNSEQPRTREIIAHWQQKNLPINFITYPKPFNFSEICNHGVEHARGEYVVLMNNDIEITSMGWIESLLGHAQRNDIGAVGAKLFYPNQTIQHAGIVIGIDQGAGHAFKHLPNSHTGYFLRHHLIHNISAVTAALLMVKKDRFLQVGGLDTDFGIAYNDVNLCLCLTQQGYRNIITPECTAIHHESITRGYDINTVKQARHDREKALLRSRWPDIFENGDPFYNRNLTLRREDYSLGVSQE
ncbi:MAG: glycosyltransferase [Gammaproteobacteria bacterium]|nr:glycosyltransferase [Gammaproteobacteria bacterium]